MVRKIKWTEGLVAERLCNMLGNDKWFTIACVKNGPTWCAKNLRIIDLVAFRRSWARPDINAYEIKINRSDFLSDNKWRAYLSYCNCFYFAAPKGVVTKQDITALRDPAVGLVNVTDVRAYTVLKPVKREIDFPTDLVRYALMSRIEAERLPWGIDKSTYFRLWLEHKLSNRQLGREVGSALLDQLADLQAKCDDQNYELGRLRALRQRICEITGAKEEG